MHSHTRTDYLVCNRLGTVVFTSPDRDLAVRWAKANEHDRGALHVEEQTVTTTRRKVWRRIDALTGDNLISKDTQNLYHLTPWGEDEVKRLGEVPDHLVGQPNARIFVGRAA